MSRALILTDGKAGHENQSRAFARALDCDDVELVGVAFKSKLHKALSYLFDRLGVRTLALCTLALDGHRELKEALAGRAPSSGARPAAVIGTGSGTFYPAKALARRLGVKCGVVLYPRGYDVGSFDCVLAPAFDRPKKAPNVVEIPANLVANDAAFYARGVAAFRERRANRPPDGRGTVVAVVVGGPNKCSTMTPGWMKTQLDAIFDDNRRTSESVAFWVTTSRRTPPDVEAVVDAYPWDFKLLYSRDHFNPIPAFVQLADRLYVTAESTGMLSEACSFGSAEVVALDNLKPGPHKFRRFVDGLRAAGCIDGRRKLDLTAPFAAASDLMRGS